MTTKLVKVIGLKGGPGSGNRGHSGRPGKVGGSGSGAAHADTHIVQYADEVRTGPMGKAYWINKKDQLVDSIDREGRGDHMGESALAYNGKALGLTKRQINDALNRINEVDVYDVLHDAFVGAFNAGNIRVRVFGDSTAIQTKEVITAVLHKLQELFYDKKLELSKAGKHYWEDMNEEQQKSFMLDQFLLADKIEDL